MRDIVPDLTDIEISEAETRKSLNLGVKYDLKSLPESKARPIAQTEQFRHGYVTHTKHPLSFREARFIDEYMVCGDGPTAVEKAGFTCKDKKAKARSLLRKDYISEEIAYRADLYSNALTADKEEVLRYFTAVMRGQIKDQFNLDAPLTERTRAAEALAKRLIDDPAKAKQNIAAQQVVVNIDFNRDEETSPVVDVQQLSD